MVSGVEGAGSSYRRGAPAAAGTGGTPATGGPADNKVDQATGDTARALASGAGGGSSTGGRAAGTTDGHPTGAIGRGGATVHDKSGTAAAIASNGGTAASSVTEGHRGSPSNTAGSTTPNSVVNPGPVAGTATLPDNNAVASALSRGADTSTSQTTTGTGNPGCNATGDTAGGDSHC